MNFYSQKFEKNWIKFRDQNKEEQKKVNFWKKNGPKRQTLNFKRRADPGGL